MRTFEQELPQMNPQNVGRIAKIVMAVFAVIVGIYIVSGAVVNVNADEIVVVQVPYYGTLHWYKQPGTYSQYWGKVTHYKKRSQFWFSAASDQGKKEDQSIKVRFNDKGHANLSGSLAWEMPLDDEHLTQLHTKYGSHEAIEQQLIRTVVEKAVYMTGPLMSSQESAAERRNELLQFVEDQVANGVYKTQTVQEKQPDPITGQPKTVSIVRLVMENGSVVRSDESPLKTFGIKTFNPSINEVKYDPVVEAQIQEQQKATMAVTTSAANAKKAEQDAITAAKNGEAEAAKAKWAQEVKKATEVTAAEQRRDVANLDRQAAEQKKAEQILLGEGEARRRQLVMDADGALDKKLEAYKEVQKYWADAVKNYQGNWTPLVSSGSSSTSTAGSGAMQLLEMMGAKAAVDLGLDLKASGAGRTSKK